MYNTFPKSSNYINSLDLNYCDELDKVTKKLLDDYYVYEKASQALRRRFVRGAEFVSAIDRGNRKTRIKRIGENGKYRYFVEGSDGRWSEPHERIWIVSMFYLWQNRKKKI